MNAVKTSAVERLRELVTKADGRIQVLYDTAAEAFKELDREWVHNPPPPPPSAANAALGNLIR